MFERFTESSMKVILLAQDESHRLGHNFVSTGQILLGAIGEGTSVAAETLTSKGITLEQARIEVEKISGRGSYLITVEIPFLPEAHRSLNLALEESEQLNHNYIDVDHLMLGMLRVEDGIGLQVLTALGVEANEVLDPITRSLSDNSSPRARRNHARALENRATIELGLEAVEELKHNYLDAEHPLPSTLLADDKIFLQVLANLGVDTTEINLVGESTQG